MQYLYVTTLSDAYRYVDRGWKITSIKNVTLKTTGTTYQEATIEWDISNGNIPVLPKDN